MLPLTQDLLEQVKAIAIAAGPLLLARRYWLCISAILALSKKTMIRL
jgi:hypothetical protein